MTNLNKLKALAESADKDDWESELKWGNDGTWTATGPIHEQGLDEFEPDSRSEACQKAVIDSDFITAISPKTVLSLIEEIEAYRTALEFYADYSNWVRTNAYDTARISKDDLGMVHPPTYTGALVPEDPYCSGGKRAREVLKKFGGRDE